MSQRVRAAVIGVGDHGSSPIQGLEHYRQAAAEARAFAAGDAAVGA
ncbi:MAG: hypothetical protein ACREN7_06765 [Candidatus Dormibacteria bacterium]